MIITLQSTRSSSYNLGMKKIIILEGIATSGKTTLKQKLADYFKSVGLNYLVVDEEATLMPILENTEKVASINLLNKVISDSLADTADVIIFDRLYFTHIFRTKSTVEDFVSIENLLASHQVILVLLTIGKTFIRDRVFKAMAHRDKSWSEFVRKKGSDEEIVDYYINQQQELIELTKNSSLKSLILDSTDLNYDKIMQRVIETTGLK